jgi:hypothetical protein
MFGFGGHDPVGRYGIVTKWRCLPLSNPACHERPPTEPDWVHEIKHDGYRLMARRDALSVGIRLLTNGAGEGGCALFGHSDGP